MFFRHDVKGGDALSRIIKRNVFFFPFAVVPVPMQLGMYTESLCVGT